MNQPADLQLNAGCVRFTVLDAISEPGHHVNEDALGATSRLAWVLDGASSRIDYLTFKTTAASRMVATLSRHLGKWEKSGTADVRNVLRAAVESSVRQIGEPKISKWEDPPSCAAGLALLEGNEVHLCILGDITVVSVTEGATRRFTDPIAMEREREISQKLNAAISSNHTLEQARDAVWEEVRLTRAKMLRDPAAYSSLPLDIRAVAHAHTYRLRLKPGDRFLLATDGFARIVEFFGVTSWEALMSDLKNRRENLQSLYAQIRERERDDASCTRFPRMSMSDDASAVYVRVDSEVRDGGP